MAFGRKIPQLEVRELLIALPIAEGRADADEFLKSFVDRRFRKTVEDTPVFLKTMPLVALSYVASTRYASDFRTGRAVFSRGGLMAAEMDERIRSKSGGTKSLRDAFRALGAWSAKTHRAFRIDELPAIFREATGVDVADVMAKWLAPMP